MDSSALTLDPLIEKRIISAGNEKREFTDGTKVTFNIKVETADTKIELDDSRKWKEPIELIFGKKFKLEVWEACIRTMLVNEVANFTVHKNLITSYPVVAKTLRDFNAKKSGQLVESQSHHCCGLGLKEGFGYEDLNQLANNPEDLIFTIDLLKVENEGSYEKEFWAMGEDERVASITQLQEDGNALYRSGNYQDSAKKYAESIGRLDNLMLKEKPGDVEWTELNKKRLLLLLNYSQCQLLLGEYYSVIEHCSEVLKYEPDNIKALFRRGKAYVEVFSPEEARDDLERVAQLDPPVGPSCQKLLHQLRQMEKDKLKHDQQIYKNLF